MRASGDGSRSAVRLPLSWKPDPSAECFMPWRTDSVVAPSWTQVHCGLACRCQIEPIYPPLLSLGPGVQRPIAWHRTPGAVLFLTDTATPSVSLVAMGLLRRCPCARSLASPISLPPPLGPLSLPVPLSIACATDLPLPHPRYARRPAPSTTLLQISPHTDIRTGPCLDRAGWLADRF